MLFLNIFNLFLVFALPLHNHQVLGRLLDRFRQISNVCVVPSAASAEGQQLAAAKAVVVGVKRDAGVVQAAIVEERDVTGAREGVEQGSDLGYPIQASSANLK